MQIVNKFNITANYIILSIFFFTKLYYFLSCSHICRDKYIHLFHIFPPSNDKSHICSLNKHSLVDRDMYYYMY